MTNLTRAQKSEVLGKARLFELLLRKDFEAISRISEIRGFEPKGKCFHKGDQAERLTDCVAI